MWEGISKPPQYKDSAITDFFEVGEGRRLPVPSVQSVVLQRRLPVPPRLDAPLPLPAWPRPG